MYQIAGTAHFYDRRQIRPNENIPTNNSTPLYCHTEKSLSSYCLVVRALVASLMESSNGSQKIPYFIHSDGGRDFKSVQLLTCPEVTAASFTEQNDIFSLFVYISFIEGKSVTAGPLLVHSWPFNSELQNRNLSRIALSTQNFKSPLFGTQQLHLCSTKQNVASCLAKCKGTNMCICNVTASSENRRGDRESSRSSIRQQKGKRIHPGPSSIRIAE